MTQGLDWHWIFWVNVPIGVIAALLARLRLAESHGPITRLDLPAATLMAGGAIAIVWGLIRAGEVGWGSGQVISLLVVGVVLIAGFLALERRASHPMLPLRLFASRGFAAANVTAFLMSGAIFAAAFLIAQYFQFALGYSPLATGLRLLPWTVTPLLVAPLAGLLSDRVGVRPVLALGMLLQSAGLGWIALIAAAGAAADYAAFVVPLIIAGVGISMAIPIAATAVVSAVAPPDMGKASGVNSTLQRFGGAFAIAVAAAVFTANGRLGTAASFTAGFRPALAVVAGLSALGAVTALGVAGRRQPVPTAISTRPASISGAVRSSSR